MHICSFIDNIFVQNHFLDMKIHLHQLYISEPLLLDPRARTTGGIIDCPICKGSLLHHIRFAGCQYSCKHMQFNP